MFSGSDWLSNLFMFVFLFGLVFTMASLLLGFAGGGGGHGQHFGGGSHDVDIHIGSHHVQIGSHEGVHSDHGLHDGPGILNMPTVMAFLTWFGGAGYIFRQSMGWNGYVAGGLALASGLVGGGIMFVLLARVLWPMMSKPMTTADYSKPGTPARVVSSIREGGVGEIVYSKSGSRFTAGARSVDGTAIAKGAEVVILRYEKGLAYVQDVSTLLEGATTDQIEAV
ncbi:MAG: hypothetical protein ABIO92_00405 [Chloroflexia bacterium]